MLRPRPAARDDALGPDDPVPDDPGPDVPGPALALIEVLLATGITDRRLAEAAAAVLPGAPTVAGLGELPGVEITPDGVMVGPEWEDVVGPLEPAHRPAVAAAARRAADHGDPETAAGLAVLAGDADILRAALRAVLAAYPVRVGRDRLAAWRDADLLPAGDPHRWWLEAAAHPLSGRDLDAASAAYDRACAGFAAAGDPEAEVAAGMTAAVLARRRDDLATLLRFIGRADELAARGVAGAVAPSRLGGALLHQMTGRPEEALAVLATIPGDALEGDWAAQVQMVAATNLMLLGRVDEAVARLERAAGRGSPWSYATTLDLLGAARWLAGDAVGALADMADAAEVAGAVAADAVRALATAGALAMRAALGDDVRRDVARARAAEPDDEVTRLLACAEVLGLVGDDDIAGARTAASRLPLPDRAVRSAYWTVALRTALLGDAPAVDDLVERHPALRPARSAGVRAAAHLAGGPPAPETDRPYLPARWCPPAARLVEIDLMGTPVVRRDRRTVDDPAWSRGRVRELCCYLAVVGDTAREVVAADLWPDLAAGPAANNLRVTLSRLLDVLDPDRRRGAGSAAVVDRDGVLRLVAGPRLVVDVRQLDRHAEAILAGRPDDGALVLSARRIARLPRGRLLGGAPMGAWADRYEAERTERSLRAYAIAGRAALRAGLPDLADDLGRRGLDEDPWAEGMYRLVVEAALARGDLDAARRALRRVQTVLDDLGARPDRATRALAHRAGVDPGRLTGRAGPADLDGSPDPSV